MTLRRHEVEARKFLASGDCADDDQDSVADVADLIATAETRGREQAAKVCEARAAFLDSLVREDSGLEDLIAPTMARTCASAIRAYTETEEADEAGGGR